MRKALGFIIALGMVSLPVFAQEVHIDYAHDFDFKTVKSFQYVETKESNHPNGLMDERIKNGIVAQLEAGGLKQAESDPDVFVTYHVAAQENAVYNTVGYGGFGAGWGAWGGGVATTTAMVYTEGTLVVDAYSAKDKKLLWQGKGTVVVKDDPEKQGVQIDNVLTKMSRKWKKILAGQGK